MPGMYVNTNSTINKVITKGNISFINSWIFKSSSEQVKNIIDPNGGVTPPIIILTTITIPKCSGSIPIFNAAGIKSGASIIIAAPPSINIPTISRMIFMKSSSDHGLVLNFKSNPVNKNGILSQLKYAPNTLAAIIINITVLVP